MGKDGKYDIIYRGEHRDYIAPGRWVFIQRAKEVGGGYWLGRVWPDFLNLALSNPHRYQSVWTSSSLPRKSPAYRIGMTNLIWRVEWGFRLQLPTMQSQP